jgi:hypothetical protein
MSSPKQGPPIKVEDNDRPVLDHGWGDEQNLKTSPKQGPPIKVEDNNRSVLDHGLGDEQNLKTSPKPDISNSSTSNNTPTAKVELEWEQYLNNPDHDQYHPNGYCELIREQSLPPGKSAFAPVDDPERQAHSKMIMGNKMADWIDRLPNTMVGVPTHDEIRMPVSSEESGFTGHEDKLLTWTWKKVCDYVNAPQMVFF